MKYNNFKNLILVFSLFLGGLTSALSSTPASTEEGFDEKTRGIIRKLQGELNGLTPNVREALFQGEGGAKLRAAARSSVPPDCTDSSEEVETIFIAAFSGGGTKGIGSAEIIKEIEKETKASGFDIFKVFTGVSTGAIIATLLAMNTQADEIINFYKNNCGDIFPQDYWREISSLNGLIKPKYEIEKLLNVIKSVVGDKKISEVFSDKDKLLRIIAFDLKQKKTIFFQNNDQIQSGSQQNYDIASIVAGSCAAPVYFSPLDAFNMKLVDGCVAGTNPCFFALEGAKELKQSSRRRHYVVVHVGTGYTEIPINPGNGSGLGWGPAQILDLLMCGPKDAAGGLLERASKSQRNVTYFEMNFHLPYEINLNETAEFELDFIINCAQEESTRDVINQFAKFYDNVVNKGQTPQSGYFGSKYLSLNELQQIIQDKSNKEKQKSLEESWIYIEGEEVTKKINLASINNESN